METRKRCELHPEDEAIRLPVRARTDVHAIQAMDVNELLALQGNLGYGDVLGVWEVPQRWMRKCSDNARRVKYATAGAPVHRASVEVLKILILLTITLQKNGKYLAPSTVLSYGRIWLRVSLECARRTNPSTGWWSRISVIELNALLKKSASKGIPPLLWLHKRGLIADAPALPDQDEGAQERDRRGEGVANLNQDTSRVWQPLPDEFTRQCGQRCLWIVRNLGGPLLDCLEACLDWAPPSDRTPLESRTLAGRRFAIKAQASKIISAWAWRYRDGNTIDSLPFSLNFSSRVRAGTTSKALGISPVENFVWPPTRWNEVIKLVDILQSAHLWLFLLASGPRQSTVLSYDCKSLVEAPEPASRPDRVHGRKFKNTSALGGQKRDWPVPHLLVGAFEQQSRLAHLVRRLSASRGHSISQQEDLWVEVNRRGRSGGVAKLDTNYSLDRLAEIFGLRHLLEADNPRVHSHRFRKTLARIIALAMSSAQVILMDNFGHDDPDQTLRYILADRAIAADVARTQRELTILMGVDAISNVDKISGAKGEQVRDEVYRFLRVKGKSKLDPEDVYELADKLTHGGRTWMLVAPGVICAAPLMESGPCGVPRGVRTDPSNCQATCQFRLVTPDRLSLLDDSLSALLTDLQRALDEDNQMLVASIVPQIQNKWFETPFTHEKWKDHPLIVSNCDHSKTPYWLSETEQ